jgi:hypothetical protein
LSDTHGFKQHHIEVRRLQHVEHIARRTRQPAEMTASRDRTDEHPLIGEMLLHPNPVAEDRAARVRARGIDRKHRDALALLAIEPNQPIDQGALARAGRARHADHIGVAIMNEDPLEQLERARVSFIDQAARACQGPHLPGSDSLDQGRQVSQARLL